MPGAEAPRDVGERIRRLKKELNAVILAHNYQLPEVQEVADYVGDSLELTLRAAETDAKYLVFAGVDFMAEQAAVLNPDKVVLHPDPGARCPMAAMLPRSLLLEYKRRYPGVPVVLYVNTLAEAKAEADYICTSANAVEVVRRVPSDRVVFGPDANLARYVELKTGKEVIAVPPTGHCYVHLSISPEDVEKLREAYPDAEVLAHPECVPEVWAGADLVGSTSSMVRRAGASSAKRFIVATEVGLLHRLRVENPAKEFVPAYQNAVCVFMKRITLEKVYESLRDLKHPVRVPPEIASRVAEALRRTFELLGASR